MSETELPFPRAATPDIRSFLVAADAYCASASPKLSSTSLSTLLFGSGRQIERLTTGKDITTGRLRAAWERLRELQAGGSRTRKPRTPKTQGASNGEEDERAARSGDEAEEPTQQQRTRRGAGA